MLGASALEKGRDAARAALNPHRAVTIAVRAAVASLNAPGSARTKARVRAQSLLAVVVLVGCGGAPPPAPAASVQIEAIGDEYYCDSTQRPSLSRMPPSGFVRIDLEKTPARDACLAAQRRLDATDDRDAGAQGDELLVKACAARRCIFWQQAKAAAERDVVKTLCIADHLSQVDVMLLAAIDARAHIDRAEPADVDSALAALRRDASNAASLRNEAAACIGADATRDLKTIAH